MINKPYRPWYDDTKDYNTNAPSYYDYLANEINLEKVQTEAINDLLVRDVDFKDSDEVHVDKLTDWHTDDDAEHAKITFKAHVITSPASTTQTIDGDDYVAANGLKVLDSGLYTPDYTQVISQQTARIKEVSATAKRAETKADNAQKGVDTINSKLPSIKTTADSALTKAENAQKGVDTINSELPTIKTNISSLQSGKQNKLQAGYGIKIDENNIITSNVPTVVRDGYELNNFNEGLIKGKNLTNAPDKYWWIIEAFTEGNYTIQNATKMVTSGNYVKTYTRYKQGSTWTEWVEQLTNKNELTEAIKTVNKSYNLQNPNIYKFHKFSNLTVTGDWGFEFFNDTNAKIYNVKVKVGTITQANPGSIIAQQSTSTLIAAGVPQDFITKATNGYVFRAGYYLGDSLKRIAFELKTESDKLNLRVKYYDTEGTVENTLVVQGHECAPIAVPYNSAVSVEENSQEKPVDDSTNE